MENKKISLFETIALTFSGGGYRAATFGLGVLSYFNQFIFKGKPLLENVKGLSTVSGGTLTGATYAFYLSQGKDFKNFYRDFYQTLEEDKLLEKALQKLDDDKLWKHSHKRRSLINAFALSYAELLTNGSFRDLKKKKIHLEDICFNATDFSFGLAFRFQTNGNFGNYRLENSILSLLSEDMKLADAIASSSCFPMGFEPIIMPDDFLEDHHSDAYITLKADKRFEKGVGIMDGGIVDNQGIGSIMLADKRREKSKTQKSFDLVMVCDVGSYFMDPWTPFVEEQKSSLSVSQIFKIIVKRLNSIWWMVIPLGLSIASFYLYYFQMPKNWLLITGGAFGVLTIICGLVKFFIGRLKKSALKYWDLLMKILPGFMKGKLKYFANLRTRLIKRMIIDRGTSAVKMISEIFLKQIRRLNYDLFYTNEDLKNRRITTLIYELTKEQYVNSESDEKKEEEKPGEIPSPGDKIYGSAKIARDMGTTLWFTEEDRAVHRLKNLVSCGQFTACYNLLKYCMDLKKTKVNIDKNDLETAIKSLLADWKHFIDDPYWLHDKQDE